MSRVLAERSLTAACKLQLVEGDLTAEMTDAIVNAANKHLQHGGGVAGAIVDAGGPVIQRESNAWVQAHGLVSHERPAWTSGGRLRARYVIHAVGPRRGDGDEDTKLSSAVLGSLGVADELRCRSISLPAISTGIFGFPLKRAARLILSAVRKYFMENESGIQLVRLVMYDPGSSFEFLQAWQDLPWETQNNAPGGSG